MKSLILFLILLVSGSGYAQLTITSADFTALVGKPKTRLTYRSDNQVLVNSFIAKTGTGQTWDLSDASFTLSDTTTEEFVAGTAGAPGANDPAFVSATHHAKSWVSSNADSVNYLFMTLSASSASALGSSWDSSGTVHKIYYTPANVVAQFPMSLGVQWTSNTVLTYSQDPGTSIPVTNQYEVDAEGILTFPGGQSKEVLRIKTMQIIDLGFYIDTTTIYTFAAKSDRESASIIAPKSVFGFPLPGSISYFTGAGGGGNQDVTEAPQLTLPADGATITATEATLEWGTVANASSYHMQVSQALDFQTIVHDNMISGTSKTYAFVPGLYFWRVAGVSAENKEGTWSAIRSFTMATSGVEEENYIFALEPNHPNPFTTETKIGYTLRSDSYVTIVVHDQLGNKVATLVDGMEYRGSHTAIFDARELPSGQYYYTLTAGGQSITMPMILIKN